MYLCFLHNISAQSIFLPLSIHSAVWFFFPCLGERSCIVGVCCLSARAKIDSKLQSLLRTPHCAAWPQNSTHRHIPTDLHTNVNYTVCCPTSLFPMQPVDVTITQNPLQLCANQQSCTRVMCLQRKLWVWFTDVNAIMASSQLTLTHKHTFKSIYADLYTFYCQSITKCSHKKHSNKIIFCVDFVDELNKLINSQTTLVSSISSKIKIKTPQKQKKQGSADWTSQVFVILTLRESKQAMTLPFSTWQLLAGWANLHSLSGREQVPLWNSRQTSSVSHFVSRIGVTFTAILNQEGGVD